MCRRYLIRCDQADPTLVIILSQHSPWRLTVVLSFTNTSLSEITVIVGLRVPSSKIHLLVPAGQSSGWTRKALRFADALE